MLNNSFSLTIKRSWSTVNALLWPAILLAFVGSWEIVGSIRPNPAWADNLLLSELLFKIYLKCALLSFSYGLLADILLGKEIFQSKEIFEKYTKKYFFVSIFLYLLPFLAHFLVFILFGKIPFQLIEIFIQPCITILWVRTILGKNRPSQTFDQKSWLIFLSTTLFYYALSGGLFLIPESLVVMKPFIIFSNQYFQFFFFLIVLSLCVPAHEPRTDLKTQKEILLINPHWSGILPWIVSLFYRSYPFFFVVLKSLTPAGYVFKEFNRVLWRDSFYCSGKLVAITAFSSNCIEAYAMAKKFRQNGSKVVMGGAHVTAFPEEALEFCDAVVVGPAEGVWGKIIQDYESDKLQGIYSAVPAEEDYEKTTAFLLQQPPNIIASCLETTRGCKFNCYFCGAGHARTGYHKHNMDILINLITKAKKHSRKLYFIGDNIFSDPAHAKEFFKRITPLNIRWEAATSIDIAKDPEALALCKQSGCSQLLIGYEIFPGSIEQEKHGKLALAREYVNLSKNIRKAGIHIKAHFIYGFESDNLLTFLKLWWFAFRLFARVSVLTLLTPIPNSKLFKDMERQDRIINLNWTKYSMRNLVFSHKSINNIFFRDFFSYSLQPFFTLTTSLFGLFLIAGIFFVFKNA